MKEPNIPPSSEQQKGEQKRELPEAWERFLAAIQKEAASLSESRK